MSTKIEITEAKEYLNYLTAQRKKKLGALKRIYEMAKREYEKEMIRFAKKCIGMKSAELVAELEGAEVELSIDLAVDMVDKLEFVIDCYIDCVEMQCNEEGEEMKVMMLRVEEMFAVNEAKQKMTA